MDSIHIHGGIPLQGQVTVQGSKNAALPVLAATILISGCSMVENCPRITDVFHMQTLLKSIGCKTVWEGGNLKVDATEVRQERMPSQEVKEMRSSISLLGSLLSRTKEAVMEHPGGCTIGERPIDIHIDALKRMGVRFEEKEEVLYASTAGLEGAELTLKFPSVGATENILLAAVLAKGETYIRGAAREPEITALCEFLQGAGAHIEGAGSSDIYIKGVEKLHESRYRIPADRIVAGTYLAGCLIAGGSILLRKAPVKQMSAVIRTAKQMGAVFQEAPEGLYVQAPDRLKTPGYIETEVYPGFPTDMQSPFLAALAVAEGESVLCETIFENRYHIVEPLSQMGADLKVKDGKVYIKGVARLKGTCARAEELRGGAALVMAGLGAEGHTKISGCGYIYRGYENIGKDLRELGARVYSV